MSETRARTGKLVTLHYCPWRSSDAVHARSRANGSAPNLSRLGFWEWVWYWRGTGPVSLQSLPDLRLAVLLRPLCSGGPDASLAFGFPPKAAEVKCLGRLSLQGAVTLSTPLSRIGRDERVTVPYAEHGTISAIFCD
jgi:hypothetical protein